MKNTLLTLATALLLLVSCDPAKIVTITDIVITPTPSPLTLTVGGESGKIDVQIAPANASDNTIILSVAPEGIVRVDDDGTVLPLRPGTATITATALLGDVTETCEVRVVEAESIVYTHVGDYTVSSGTADEFVWPDATIEFTVNGDRSTATMKMIQAKFAGGMPMAMDITVTGITLIPTRDGFQFSGDGLIPTTPIGGADAPVERYTFNGLTGSVTNDELSWETMCGPYPLSFEGTHTAE